MTPTKVSKRHQTPDVVLKSNPQVSKSVVTQYRELAKKLEKLGVDTKPRYTLSPPLGGAVSNLSKK